MVSTLRSLVGSLVWIVAACGPSVGDDISNSGATSASEQDDHTSAGSGESGQASAGAEATDGVSSEPPPACGEALVENQCEQFSSQQDEGSGCTWVRQFTIAAGGTCSFIEGSGFCASDQYPEAGCGGSNSDCVMGAGPGIQVWSVGAGLLQVGAKCNAGPTQCVLDAQGNVTQGDEICACMCNLIL